MELDTQKKLEELEEKINAIYQSVEKTRKYFLIVLWVSIILFVLPLIGMVFVIPQFFNTYLGSFQGLL